MLVDCIKADLFLKDYIMSFKNFKGNNLGELHSYSKTENNLERKGH